MIGTLINVAAILIGGTLGLFLGKRIPERLRTTVVSGLGLFTLAFGFSNFLKTENSLVVLGSLLLGVLLGEWWKIEDGLNSLGVFLESKFNRGNSDPNRFIRGFLTSSLLFCVGPMAILGSIQDGLTGDYKTLAIKATLDGFAALAFASTLGVGVLFSSLVVLVYQGAISLLAGQLNVVLTEPMMLEMTAAGGVILMGIAVSSLLEIKPIRTGSFLPALALAPLIVALLAFLGLQ